MTWDDLERMLVCLVLAASYESTARDSQSIFSRSAQLSERRCELINQYLQRGWPARN